MCPDLDKANESTDPGRTTRELCHTKKKIKLSWKNFGSRWLSNVTYCFGCWSL